eukprot:105932-Rhodomonas_salina.2
MRCVFQTAKRMRAEQRPEQASVSGLLMVRNGQAHSVTAERSQLTAVISVTPQQSSSSDLTLPSSDLRHHCSSASTRHHCSSIRVSESSLTRLRVEELQLRRKRRALVLVDRN